MNKSTWVIIAGVVLLLFPIPPVATTIAGVVTIAAGGAMRLLTGS